jgi:hypothetical protein
MYLESEHVSIKFANALPGLSWAFWKLVLSSTWMRDMF